MEQITKVVQQIGNGAHIYLPKETIGKKVVITIKEKTIQNIEEEIISILKPYLKNIKGIYLYGSYARNEQTPDSDIDILVITDSININRKTNEYEIISATEKQIQKTIENNAVLILPILKETKAILNQELIEKYKKSKLTKKNTKWYIETTESSLNLAKYLLEEKTDIASIVYPLILRLKGLYLINLLIDNKQYSHKYILNYLINEGIPKAEEIYNMYKEYRDNKQISDNSLTHKDIENLYSMIVKYFNKVKSLWAKLR